MLAVTPNTEPIDVSEPSVASLDEVAELVMMARRKAQEMGEEFLGYLLGMALIEIADRGVARSG